MALSRTFALYHATGGGDFRGHRLQEKTIGLKVKRPTLGIEPGRWLLVSLNDVDGVLAARFPPVLGDSVAR